MEAARTNQPQPTEQCYKALHLSFFFDGTNNNEPADKRFEPRCTSNVARLYHATVEQTRTDNPAKNHKTKSPPPSYFRYYCPGVGTVFSDIGEDYPNSDGLVAAEGGENRINWG